MQAGGYVVGLSPLPGTAGARALAENAAAERPRELAPSEPVAEGAPAAGNGGELALREAIGVGLNSSHT